MSLGSGHRLKRSLSELNADVRSLRLLRSEKSLKLLKSLKSLVRLLRSLKSLRSLNGSLDELDRLDDRLLLLSDEVPPRSTPHLSFAYLSMLAAAAARSV